MGKYLQKFIRNEMKNMKNAKEFYKATMNKQPSGLIRNFFLKKYNEKLNGRIFKKSIKQNKSKRFYCC